MKIDNLEIDPQVILAPMAGVTDLPYRQVVREIGGCGLVYTEMVSAKGLVYGNQRTEKLLQIKKQELPVAVQLFGNQPEILAQATKKVKEVSQPDIIDLNVGCPTPKIVKDGSGSALMKEPQLLGEIVAAMTGAVEIPITIKIRAGWDSETINACQIAKIAAENGAQAIGVHGRTREQFYEGKADWEVINQVNQAVSIPVIGNGDIFSPQDAQEMIEQTDCAAVMVARGAQGNPWLCKRIAYYLETGELLPAPTPREKIDQAIDHLERLVEYKGEYVGIREMRKHASWYLKGLSNCTTVKDQVNQAQSKAEMKRILIEYQNQFS
ncbi:tRNA dihydrouridine synthase DusB [Halanaerobaculum tunisiense]